MRAILTRHARRALVRRLASPAWPSLATPTSPSLPPHLQCHGRRICRRSFITSLFQKPPREIRATEYEPGWMQIMIWRSRVLDNLQPPPRTELHKAWTQLMLYKISVQRPLNDTQISQCHRLFEYLWSPEEKSKDSLNELDMAIKVLGIMSHTAWSIDETSRQPSRRQAAFARAILAWVESTMPNGGWADQDLNPVRLVTMLCQSGEVDEALRLIRDWPWSSDALMHQAAAIIPSYLTLLEDAPKLAQLQDVLKVRSADPNFLWKKMTTLYARYDQVDETLSCAKAATARLPLARWSRSDLYEIARFAVRNQQERWMEDLLSESPGQTNSKAFWVETVCRPFLLNGSWKDAKAAIEKLWEEGHGGKFQAHAWLELAREESDEQLANEVTAYAASQGIAPNERDYLEWLLLKLDKKHLEGAKFSYERLRDVETFSASKAREWAKYQVALNMLLCLSCSQTTPDFTYITQVLEHVDEVQAYLEPETIAKLSLRFLENEQYLDAMDLLAVHAFKLGESDRQIVQNAFASFCKDPLISTGRAWSAYQVLEQYFPDLECPERVELMEEFFRRKRSDMALAVFAAMRNHRSPAYRPDEKVYRQCFEGFARNPDLESTERVHAWLKTDQSITPSTTLFTALMLAYTAAERPLVALDFWKEITTCKEGPGYGSLAAVFWALEQRSDGAKMARDIWTRIETMDIEVPTYVYSSYAGAIAASGQILEVQKVINNMASYVGTPPEPLTLGIAHNALPSRELQVEFEEWAKSRYRVQWSELAKAGRRMNEFGLCQFKIQRRLKA